MLERPYTYHKKDAVSFQSPCGEFNVGKVKVMTDWGELAMFQSPCGEFNVGKVMIISGEEELVRFSPLAGNLMLESNQGLENS